MADEHHHHDPTFYRTPRDAAEAPPEKLAYVAAFSRPADQPDAIAVLDVDPDSARYGSVIGFTELPHRGDELHHFGWNACSSALHPGGGHDHGGRRYLVVPGIRSSRVSILDIEPDPAAPAVVKVLDADDLGKRAGYSRPHTVHCGPGAVFMSCLGGYGEEGPGGIALLDQNTFDVLGAWEADRGDQFLAYDVWWHVMADVAITSEWGTPAMIEDGVVPELLLGRKYGHRLHFWNMQDRKLIQTVDLGDQHQMALELRPAHDPTKKYGFVGVVVSVEDLSASIWMWHEDNGQWTATKVITIPAEPAPRSSCRRCCRASVRCPRWSPTSTCRWTTSTCTCPAGALVSSSSTTSPTRCTRSRPARCGSAGSSAGPPTRRGRTSRSAAARRWSR